MMKKAYSEKLWTKSYLLTLIAMTLIFIPFALTQSFFPMYIMEKLNGPTQLAGFSNTVFSIACILFRVHMARLEKLLGINKTIKLSCLFFLLSYVLYLTTANIAITLGIRFFSGICYAIANTSLMSIGIRFLPQSRKNEGIAYLTTVAMVGWAIGPFIGVNILEAWDYHGMFLFCGLAFLPCILLLFFVDTKKIEAGKLKAEMPQPVPTEGFHIRNYIEVDVLPLCCAALLLSGAYSSVVSFVVAYANSLDLFAVSAYYFLLLAMFAVFTRLMSGRISRRIGENLLVFLSYAVLSVGLVLLSFARTTSVMLLSGVLIGASTGFITPSLQAIAVRKTPVNRVSVTTATYMTSMDIGSGLGAFVIGLSIPMFGYSKLYLMLSPIMLCIPPFFFWIYIHKLRRVGIAESATLKEP